MWFTAALVLGASAGAQLFETPRETAGHPLLQGFTAKGQTLTRGKTTVTLDVAGGRVVGVLVQADNAADVARGLVAAWGGSAADMASLTGELGRAAVQREARRSLGLQQDDGTVLRLRLTGEAGAERWTAYTALLVHPESAFPATANAEGNAGAPNVLRVFSDFQCPYCKQMWDTAQPAWKNQPHLYRVLHYHFPLEKHANAEPAAVASECAGQQGRFWPFADLLFKHSAAWTSLPKAKATLKFGEYASAAGLNPAAFKTCLTGDTARATVRAQYAAGLRVDVQGTPTVYLNGLKLMDYADPQELALVRAVTTATPSAAQVIDARLKTLR